MTFFHFVSFDCTFTHVLTDVFANPAMASPLLGSVGEFDRSSKTFTAYLERVDQFFVANDIGNCVEDANAAVIRAANLEKVVRRRTALITIGAALLLIQKTKHLRHYVNYCNNILSPSDWKLPNPTDFIDVVKKKIKPCRFTVRV